MIKPHRTNKRHTPLNLAVAIAILLIVLLTFGKGPQNGSEAPYGPPSTPLQGKGHKTPQSGSD